MSVKIPDFVLAYFVDGNMPKGDNMRCLFVNIKNATSIDGGLSAGGEEHMSVDVFTGVDTYQGSLTLGKDSFVLKKDVNLQKGSYIVEFKGQRKYGNTFTGDYKAINSNSQRDIPYFGGAFQVNLNKFFEKRA